MFLTDAHFCLMSSKRNNNNKPLLKWYREREELYWLRRWIYAPKITSSIHLWFIRLCFLAIYFMSIATLHPLGKMSTRVVSCYWIWCHWIAGFLWRRFGTWRVSFEEWQMFYVLVRHCNIDCSNSVRSLVSAASSIYWIGKLSQQMFQKIVENTKRFRWNLWNGSLYFLVHKVRVAYVKL